jgi:hypothetical protein
VDTGADRPFRTPTFAAHGKKGVNDRAEVPDFPGGFPFRALTRL